MAPSTGLFSRQAIVALPTTKADLATIYNGDEEEDVATQDGIRVDLAAVTPAYFVHQFKFQNANTTDFLEIELVFMTTDNPAVEPVFLQIWNNTTLAWVTISTYSTYTIDENVVVHTTVSSGLSDYYDTANDNEIALRAYQFNS